MSAPQRDPAISSGGRYRRLRSRLWLDPPFAALSDADKLAALYVLSGPQTTATGLYRLSPAAAAEDLRCSTQVFQRRFDAALKALGWRYDRNVRVVWLPTWIEENPPQNPNQVRAWRAAFDEIPDCPLKREAATAILAFLEQRGEPFAKPFRQPFANGLANGSGNGSPSGSQKLGRTADPSRPARRLANAKSNERLVERLRGVRGKSGTAATAEPSQTLTEGAS